MDTEIEIDHQRVLARVEGRRIAKELCSFIEPSDLQSREFMMACIEQMLVNANILMELKPVDISHIETPEPIARLGATEMPFGQHMGEVFDDVPLAYLDWLCSSQEEFYKKLRAYLRHPELESLRGSKEINDGD